MIRSTHLRPAMGLMLLLALGACGDDAEPSEDAAVGSGQAGLVRGRVRVRDGSELERLEVRAGERSARTDADGFFELEVPAGGDQRVRVDSDDFTGGEAVVRVERDDEASVDLEVMRLRRLPIEDAERGGRFEGEEGFALELPERSLRRADGEVARGPAELRYAVVTDPEDMRVPPDLRTRDGDGNDRRLRSRGMFEVRFYQDGERLEFEGEARAEMRLPEESDLREGDRLGAYHYDVESLRWERLAEAEVREGKWVARLDRFSWWTAAELAGDLGCVQAQLRTPGDAPAAGSVVTAIGLSELWLSTAEVDEEGRVCLEAPTGTSLSLSAYWSSAEARGQWGAQASVPSAAGMCGGDACESLGSQTFEGGAIGGGGDGGVTTGGSMDGGSTGTMGGNTGTTGGSMDGGAGPLFEGLMETAEPSGPGQTVRFAFDAQGAERLAYTLVSAATTTADVRVVDPTGAALSQGRAAVQAGAEIYEDDFRLPNQAGQYAIEVTPRNEGTGSFTLDLFGVPEDVRDTLVIDGDPVTVALGSIGQNAQLTLSASGGERLAYTVTNNVSSTVDVNVFDPAGVTLNGPGIAVTAQGDNFQDLFVLPATAGDYTFEINPRQQGTGTFTIDLFSVPAETTQPLVIDGDPATVNLTDVAQNGAFTFEASGGERLAYTVQSTASNTIDIDLLDPTGTNLGGAGGLAVVAGGDNFEDAFVLPDVAGTYQLTVNPRQQGTGGLTLTLFSVPDDVEVPISINGGDGEMSIPSVAQNGVYTFVAEGGDRLAYTVVSAASNTADLTVRDPDGNVVSGAGLAVVAGGTNFEDAFELPQLGGTYRIEVDPRQQGTGGFSLDLFSVPADATASFTLSGYSQAASNVLSIPSVAQNGEFLVEVPTADLLVAYFVTNGGSSTVDLDVFDPSGVEITQGGRAVTAGATAFEEPFRLGEAGTYQVAVNPRQQGTAPGPDNGVVLQMYFIDPEQLTAGVSVDSTGTPQTVQVPGQQAAYTFALTAGMSYRYTVTGDSTADLTLLAPDGQTDITPSGSRVVSGEMISAPFTASTSDTYTLIVDPRSDGTGIFTVEVATQ